MNESYCALANQLIPTHVLQQYIRLWAEEDCSSYDIAGAIIPEQVSPLTAQIICKTPGVLCGLPVVQEVFAFFGCQYAAP